MNSNIITFNRLIETYKVFPWIFGLVTQKLVNNKNAALVEYAAASKKDQQFVSRYKLNFTSEKDLKAFIENKFKKEGLA